MAELEALGYGAVWFPEGRRSKEALTHAALVLQGTSWTREPVTSRCRSSGPDPAEIPLEAYRALAAALGA